MSEASRKELAEQISRTFYGDDGERNLTNNKSRSYTKYGVYNDAQGHEEFLLIRMTADDDNPDVATRPFEELDADDFYMDKPMRFNFETNDWEKQKGLMKMISNPSFEFMEEESFFDELLRAIDHHKHHHRDDSPHPNGAPETMDND